ncbi:MAG: hypothetical protein ACOCYB_02215 [Alkalispirochaeta sp.]
MFGFVIKKSFFDLWDNFLPAVLMNLGFIVLFAVPAILPSAFAEAGPVVSVLALVLGVVLLFVYAGGVFGLSRAITDHQSIEWSEFLQRLRDSWPAAVVLAAINVVHLFLLSVAFPVYTSLDNMVGLFALAILFWMSVIWWITAPYYFPLRQRLTAPIPAALKKSFIFTFDNTGFTLGLALGAVLLVVLSLFTAFLIPGIAGLAIWYQTAVKLRLYKYDYLQEHPDANRKDIPWDALLFDDRERVGKRTLRGMIFPWKD